jgi:hypothetical protein
MTTVTNPNTLSQACAGLSAPHAPVTGTHPASIEVARATPIVTSPIATM